MLTLYIHTCTLKHTTNIHIKLNCRILISTCGHLFYQCQIKCKSNEIFSPLDLSIKELKHCEKKKIRAFTTVFYFSQNVSGAFYP